LKTGKTVVQALKQEEVKTIFGLPGAHILPVYDALYDEEEIQHILVRHEQAAGYMADGYARSTGKIGVCLLASGPGVLNAVTAVTEAYLSSTPMVVLAGGPPIKLRGKGAIHEMNQLQVFQPITKWQKILKNSQEVFDVIHKAFQIALLGRPRPVYVELPFDILIGETKLKNKERLDVYTGKISVKERDVEKVLSLLLKSNRPVILAGGGVVSANATNELAELSETLQIPVVLTYMSRGAIPENSKLFLGTLPDKYSFYLIQQADLVLALGCKFSETTTATFRLKIPNLVQVDIDPEEIGKNYSVKLGLIGDIKAFLKSLVEKVKSLPRKNLLRREEWLREVLKFKSERVLEYETEINSNKSPIKPQRLMKEIADIVTSETTVTCDSGYNTWWTNIFIKPSKPRKLLTPVGNWTMGFSFPAGIGAKIGNPENPVVCICGEGGFMISCAELTTIVEYKIPVIIVVMNNGWFGAIRSYQKHIYNRRFIASKLQNPCFAEIAKAFGVESFLIRKPEEIKDSLKTALNLSKPTLLDVYLDPEEEIPTWFLETFYGKKGLNRRKAYKTH